MAKRVPSLTLHKPTGQARVRIEGRDIYLGKHGSDASEQRYHQLIAEWLSSGIVPPRPTVSRDAPADDGLTVNELLLAYWTFCEGYYRDADGMATKEQGCIKLALRPVKKLYGTTMAAQDFGTVEIPSLSSCGNRKGNLGGFAAKGCRWDWWMPQTSCRRTPFRFNYNRANRSSCSPMV